MEGVGCTSRRSEGPLVLLLHGFPECWYNWRHQFTPLAGAGYHVVAVDQRGYARSDRPAAVEEYTILHLVGDAIGLIRELGAEQAVVIGHDLGGMVAWSTALMRPDVVRGVVGLSVPPPQRGPVPPLQAMRELFGGQFYWNYFQSPGVADAELAKDPHATFRRVMYGLCGDNRTATRRSSRSSHRARDSWTSSRTPRNYPPGSPRPTSTHSRRSSPKPGSPAHSTGTATSTAIGS
ncbi:alpha/beta fold hydrolase [Streptomyces sp. NBC_00259]|uniref:alpha/beta fold hydrolase n=1 Tax=Streptomyces sp. NBC_00259 TaxID=2903643 RepID=UPI002E2CF8B0|nr:alpha/beta hydrolase [Streptomyces sp. NBC_00259]